LAFQYENGFSLQRGDRTPEKNSFELKKTGGPEHNAAAIWAPGLLASLEVAGLGT
jgi:hypothetical protein